MQIIGGSTINNTSVDYSKYKYLEHKGINTSIVLSDRSTSKLSATLHIGSKPQGNCPSWVAFYFVKLKCLLELNSINKNFAVKDSTA